MKRLIVLPLIILMLCGCSKIEKATPIIENISCVAEIEYNHSNYVCNLELLNDSLNLKIIEPQEISGLSFLVNKNKITTEYKGIVDAPELNDLPQYLIARIIFEIINEVRGKTIEFDEYNGIICSEINGYEFGFVFAPSGLPISLSIEDINLEIYFKDVSLIQGD